VFTNKDILQLAQEDEMNKTNLVTHDYVTVAAGLLMKQEDAQMRQLRDKMNDFVEQEAREQKVEQRVTKSQRRL